MDQPEPVKVLRLRSVVRGNRTQKPGCVCRRRLPLGEITFVDAAGIRGYMWAVLLLLCFASSRALDPSHRVARPHTGLYPVAIWLDDTEYHGASRAGNTARSAPRLRPVTSAIRPALTTQRMDQQMEEGRFLCPSASPGRPSLSVPLSLSLTLSLSGSSFLCVSFSSSLPPYLFPLFTPPDAMSSAWSLSTRPLPLLDGICHA